MNADTNTATRMRFQDGGYENVAESHGAEDYGPSGAAMHEGEHAGYDAGFRAGSGHQKHRHHGFRVIIGG
jgi:hypothetical protein